VPYRTLDGLTLQIDPNDYFQGCMMLGLYADDVLLALTNFADAGSTVIDAGSHLGYVSLHAAKVVGEKGRVHSFECDPRLFRRLQDHIVLNNMHWIKANYIALSDKSNSEVPLKLTAQLGWSTTRLDSHVTELDQIIVPSTTLDDYVAAHGIDPERASVIKIDVEGSELEVLLGAQATLSVTRAVVLVEFEPERMRLLGQDPRELFDLMKSHGYSPWKYKMTNNFGRVRFDLCRHGGITPGDIIFSPERQRLQ